MTLYCHGIIHLHSLLQLWGRTSNLLDHCSPDTSTSLMCLVHNIPLHTTGRIQKFSCHGVLLPICPLTQPWVTLLLLTAQHNELQLYLLFPETLHLVGHLSHRKICQPHPASVANFLIRYQFKLAFILGILIYRKYSIKAYLEEQGVLLLHFLTSIWIHSSWNCKHADMTSPLPLMYIYCRYKSTDVKLVKLYNVQGSVHRKYIPIYIQQDAKLHSSFVSANCSTCFGWYLHPSSRAHTTVSTASGTCQTDRERVGTQFQLFHDSDR